MDIAPCVRTAILNTHPIALNTVTDHFCSHYTDGTGDHGNGWFLLRISLHDPLMPLNIESDEEGGVLKTAKELSGFLAGCDQLDTSKLEAYAASSPC